MGMAQLNSISTYGSSLFAESSWNEKRLVIAAVLHLSEFLSTPHALHGLAALDDETIERCSTPTPRSSATKQRIVTTRSNNEE